MPFLYLIYLKQKKSKPTFPVFLRKPKKIFYLNLFKRKLPQYDSVVTCKTFSATRLKVLPAKIPKLFRKTSEKKFQ